MTLPVLGDTELGRMIAIPLDVYTGDLMPLMCEAARLRFGTGLNMCQISVRADKTITSGKLCLQRTNLCVNRVALAPDFF